MAVMLSQNNYCVELRREFIAKLFHPEINNGTIIRSEITITKNGILQFLKNWWGEKMHNKEKMLEEAIRELCVGESFAVLATQGSGQPYASLIGFATSEDLIHLVFATPKQTRKYALLEKNNQVALLVDSRSSQPDSLDYLSALTITGKAEILSSPEERNKWGALLTDKHPYLRDFLASPDTAVVVVEVHKYLYVRKFQEVSEWIPAKAEQ
jgi:nitroimidazol reductase NimA-like FMN-containing flavoprotein (pyridoxamine 5'-phosphate oxidase superfamily)